MLGLFGYLRQDEGLADVYLYDSRKPITGYVADATPELVFIKRISDGPSYDGGSLVSSDLIARIHKGSRALESQNRLIAGLDEPDWPGLDLRSWQALASGLKLSGDIVRITLGRGEKPVRFVGKIIHFEDDILEMDAVGSYDDPDREQIFLKFTDITQIDFSRRKDADLFSYNLRALGPG